MLYSTRLLIGFATLSGNISSILNSGCINLYFLFLLMSTHNICFLREVRNKWNVSFRANKSWLDKWILTMGFVRGQVIILIIPQSWVNVIWNQWMFTFSFIQKVDVFRQPSSLDKALLETVISYSNLADDRGSSWRNNDFCKGNKINKLIVVLTNRKFYSFKGQVISAITKRINSLNCRLQQFWMAFFLP